MKLHKHAQKTNERMTGKDAVKHLFKSLHQRMTRIISSVLGFSSHSCLL